MPASTQADAAPPDTESEGPVDDAAEPPAEGGRPPDERPNVHAYTRAREGGSQNHHESGESGGLPAAGDPSEPDVPVTEGDETGGGNTEKRRRIRPLFARLAAAAQRWGLDFRPPRFVSEPLPALAAARRYARSGDQAPVTGPARKAAVVYERAAFPLRFALRFGDWLLERPARALVALGLWALLARVEAVRSAASVAAVVLERATYFTGLQWLLGLT